MGRSPCCSKEGLNRGAWTAIEDQILSSYIKAHGEGKWRNLPKQAGLKRCGKSCRLRWLNYLRPDIKRGNISRDEEELIIRLHNLLGNRWSLIAGRLPGRTDNEIKNYWNTTLGKKAKTSAHTPTSPLLKGKSSTPLPSSAPATKATRPQVVRARATRYAMSDLVSSDPSRPFDDQYCTLDPSSQVGRTGQCAQDSRFSRMDFWTDLYVQDNCSNDFGFLNVGWCDDGSQATNGTDGGKGGIYFGNYYSNHVSMEEATLENQWGKGYGGGVVDKDTLDIESLTFLFDADQWIHP